MPASPKGGKIEAHPAEFRERAFKMYCDGKSHDEIGETLKIAGSTVAAWSSKGKWAARKRAWLADTPTILDGLAKLDAPASAIAEDSTFSEKQTSYKDKMASQALRIMHVIEAMPAAMLITAADKVEKLDKIARKALCLETASPAVVVNVALLSQGSQPSVVVALPSSQSAIALPSSEHLTTVEHTGNNPEDAVLEAVTLPA